MTRPGVPGAHREVRLAARPQGPLTTRHFDVVQVPLPQAGPGRVLVRNRFMSVGAGMRMMMERDAAVPMPLYEPGKVLWGPAVGEVIDAGGEGLEPGCLVSHHSGWREYAAVPAHEARRLEPDALPDPALGVSWGFTAWLAVAKAARVRPGDTVFVTSAAGGVGSLAGQLARLHGATRVIGSTGSRHKADILLRQLGYDAALLRGTERFDDRLRQAAAPGLDVIIDTVGGEQLRAGLALARPGARVALVGCLSGQADGGTTTPVELDTAALIARGITITGVSSLAHTAEIPQWEKEFGQAVRSGRLTVPQARLTGIEQAPRALCELLEGRYVGGVLVEL
jgi:NADPH-dependent curcumin reductase CurA